MQRKFLSTADISTHLHFHVRLRAESGKNSPLSRELEGRMLSATAMAEVAMETPASFSFFSESLRILAHSRLAQQHEVEKMLWASEMAHQVKGPAAKPANLSSIPMISMVECANWLSRLRSDSRRSMRTQAR